ncbi:Argininosuccinate lyase [hydrothermal vent metagenome]|uniref:Argininosuccinate lyase n=1 Tax=hydrothermal vent metagenome TaxID=652676 RepID=A0A3B1B364_9ZZZZ
MGLVVQIASRGEYSLISEVHDGLHVDFENPRSALANILQQAAKTPFAAVLGSDDSTVELAAQAAAELGLPHNPPAAARLTRRKDLARTHLARHGCAVPRYWLIKLEHNLDSQISDICWPCVIKPLNLSASRGVIRANNRAEFHAAVTRVRKIIANSGKGFEQKHVLVEEYIDGVEVAYEGFLDNGILTSLVIFDKPDPLTGPFFEETIYVTPSQLPAAMQEKINQRVAQACRAYGLITGPVHAELRVNEKDAWILEVACRTIGGDCARSLDQSNFNLEELTLALAMGKTVHTQALEDARGVMMIPVKQAGILRRVEGLAAAQKVEHIESIDIIIREGHELIPLPEGNQYPGYIFARAETPDAVIAALHKAHAKLNFVVAPAIRLQRE